MNKRLKVVSILLVVFCLLFTTCFVPKAYAAAFSKDDVIFNTRELGISSPDDITSETQVIRMQVYDSTKTYSVQCVPYSESEFNSVGFYLKQAMGIQNLGSAYRNMAQAKQSFYLEKLNGSLLESDRLKYEGLYNDAKAEEQAVVNEYEPKVAKAIQDYVDNCIRYPSVTNWTELDSNASVRRDEIDTADYYMMWLRGIATNGLAKYMPVLYSPPGTFQVINFNSSIKTNIPSIDIKGQLSLDGYLSYNKGRKDEPTKWTSLDTSVLTVNQDGVVTGVSNGYAIVRAENEDSYDAVVIYVTDKESEEVIVPSPQPSTSPQSGMTIERQGNDLIITQDKGAKQTVPGTYAGEKDDTVAKGKYPDTGKISLIAMVVGLIAAGVYVLVQTIKMRDVK